MKRAQGKNKGGGLFFPLSSFSPTTSPHPNFQQIDARGVVSLLLPVLYNPHFFVSLCGALALLLPLFLFFVLDLSNFY